jgi:N-acyl-D-aspartate/D-glutamate deacylase
MWFDICLVNGRIFDGANNPWYRADVSIKDGKIAKIGKLGSDKASVILDIKGQILCPGFIDIHNHAEMSLLMDPKMESMTRQGVTTLVNGQCGGSPAPVNKNNLELQELGSRRATVDVDWTTMDGYFKRVEKQGVSPNIVTLVGHGNLRYYVMGSDFKRTATGEEIEKMKELVRQAMQDGALGLSTGLTYAPGYYAHTSEVIELAKVAAEYGGIYASHIREWGSKVLGWPGELGSHIEGVTEAIEIGRKSGVPRVEISHLSAQRKFIRDPDQFNKVRKLITSAREEGIDVTVDAQPESWDTVRPAYKGSIPPEYFEDSVENLVKRLDDPTIRAKIKDDMKNKLPMDMGFHYHSGKLLLIRAGKGDCLRVYPPLNGHLKTIEYEYKTLGEIAEMKGKDLYETLFDLIVENEGNVFIQRKQMDWDLKMTEYTWPMLMVGTDGGTSTQAGSQATERVRPTGYGAYPLILRWVKEKKILPMEDMIRKMTSMPARTIGLKDRGLIKEGFWADITVFDPDTVRSRTSYTNETEEWVQGEGDGRPFYPEGINYVLVNGQFIVNNSEHTGELPGKVLRHPF